jgi:hypothetical protein
MDVDRRTGQHVRMYMSVALNVQRRTDLDPTRFGRPAGSARKDYGRTSTRRPQTGGSAMPDQIFPPSRMRAKPPVCHSGRRREHTAVGETDPAQARLPPGPASADGALLCWAAGLRRSVISRKSTCPGLSDDGTTRRWKNCGVVHAAGAGQAASPIDQTLPKQDLQM